MPKASEIWERKTRNILDALADAIAMIEVHCRPCGKLDECDGPCGKVAEEIVAIKKMMKVVNHAVAKISQSLDELTFAEGE